jgi:phosphate transport system protein
MSLHLTRALEQLDKEILNIGAIVEEAINKAILALVSRRPDLAQEVVQGDDLIDHKEVECEDFCLQILALHQPVAADLRFIIAVMKVNNDLERMGDLAVNIAERAIFLSKHEPLNADLDFTAMVTMVKSMVRRSLDALINLDVNQARLVIADDDVVDKHNREMKDILLDVMRKRPVEMERALITLYASRHLERIADLAVNICEDIVFTVEGEVIRHQHHIHTPPTDGAKA